MIGIGIILVIVIVIISVVAFFIKNNENNMESNQMQNQVSSRTSAKDFFINLGAIVALGFFVGNLISLLFTIINKAYPLANNYSYYDSSSISFPVAALIIFFPIYVLLMWLLERGYVLEPEKRNIGIRKWLTYITLFISGLALAGDLVTVLFFFIDGRDVTIGFMLKALSVLAISLSIFFYYISDVMGKSNKRSRKIWVIISVIVIILCIVWGFSVLGSPKTQRLLKDDQTKVEHLNQINNLIVNYYSNKGILPNTIKEISDENYDIPKVDPQGKLYEYKKVDDITYNLCAEFNKASDDKNVIAPDSYPNSYGSEIIVKWTHPIGKYCFQKTINPNLYSKPAPKY